MTSLSSFLIIFCFVIYLFSAELHVMSSMESKLSDGFPMQMMALLNLNYNSHQVPYLTVQLINPDHDVFGTGVVVSRFVILVTGSPISKYENKPKCGGVEVKFNGELYSIANCESRFDIAVNLDEIHSKRLYNDIAIVVVRCFTNFKNYHSNNM